MLTIPLEMTCGRSTLVSPSRKLTVKTMWPTNVLLVTTYKTLQSCLTFGGENIQETNEKVKELEGHPSMMLGSFKLLVVYQSIAIYNYKALLRTALTQP
jgi:hypothetical protein